MQRDRFAAERVDHPVEAFDFRIGEEKVTKPAKIIWRDQMRLGIHFQ